MWGGALLAPDRREGAFDHPVLGRRLEPGVAMGDGDRGQFPADRGGPIRYCQVRQIGREGSATRLAAR